MSNSGVARSPDDYNAEINNFIRRGERRHSDASRPSPTHSRNGSASPRRFSEPVVSFEEQSQRGSSYIPNGLEPPPEEDESQEFILPHADNLSDSSKEEIVGDDAMAESLFLSNGGDLEVEDKSCDTKEVVCRDFRHLRKKEMNEDKIWNTESKEVIQ